MAPDGCMSLRRGQDGLGLFVVVFGCWDGGMDGDVAVGTVSVGFWCGRTWKRRVRLGLDVDVDGLMNYLRCWTAALLYSGCTALPLHFIYF